MKIGGKISIFAAVICITAFLAGCGSSYYDNGMQYKSFTEPADVAYEAAEADSWGTDQSYTDASAQIVDPARKIIRRVSMNVETKEFDSLIAGIGVKVSELGGYTEQSNIYNGSSYTGYRSARSATMTVRIPQNRLDEFVREVSTVGNVTRKTESVDDITLSYVDTESRQKALKTEQERLLTLLSEAESLEDILTIESRLSEVRYQMENYTSTLRTYDNLVDYSTVTLSIEEVKELTPVKEETAWQRMGNGFVDSVMSVADGLKEAVIWFVIHIPQLIVWAAVITVIVLIRRAYKKKHTGKLHFGRKKKQEAEDGQKK